MAILFTQLLADHRIAFSLVSLARCLSRAAVRVPAICKHSKTGVIFSIRENLGQHCPRAGHIRLACVAVRKQTIALVGAFQSRLSRLYPIDSVELTLPDSPAHRTAQRRAYNGKRSGSPCRHLSSCRDLRLYIPF